MRQERGISSFTLHILAMALMLCDHLWATIFPYAEWLTCIGRLAFPIFAFMVAEGFYRTHDRKKYLLRLLLFAVISELPFNLLMASSVWNPYHQNVLWTFVLAVLFMLLMEWIKTRIHNTIIVYLLWAVLFILSVFVGLVTFVDYYMAAIPTVLVFYIFRDRKPLNLVLQAVILYYLHAELLGGYGYDIHLFGHIFFLKQQALAVLALLPIWLYNGRQGYHAKWFQYACYSFYPVHMIVIYVLWRSVI